MDSKTTDTIKAYGPWLTGLASFVAGWILACYLWCPKEDASASSSTDAGGDANDNISGGVGGGGGHSATDGLIPLVVPLPVIVNSQHKSKFKKLVMPTGLLYYNKAKIGPEILKTVAPVNQTSGGQKQAPKDNNMNYKMPALNDKQKLNAGDIMHTLKKQSEVFSPGVMGKITGIKITG